jgi:steroid 5-alpha reductase family enzyme
MSGMLLSLAAVIVTITVAFVVGRVRHRYRDIDVFWPLGFVAVAVTGFVATSGTDADVWQRFLLLSTVSLWGGRLATHLAWRSRGQGEDPRYEAMMRKSQGRGEVWAAIGKVYLLQAALLWFISLPITVGMRAGHPLRAVQVLGVVVWFVGWAIEGAADKQLTDFLKDPDQRGRVLDTGLWAWSRHPNYFGDATAWWGMFIIAASGGWALLTVLSPLLMTRLLTSVSGKPMLEHRLRRTRPGYEEYVARTSGFVPRRPRPPGGAPSGV